jgi:hypothetical protein
MLEGFVYQWVARKRGASMNNFFGEQNVKRTILSTILVITLAVSIIKFYNYQQEKDKFNIVFMYGVEDEVNALLFHYNKKPKNVLNTLNDTFEKDLVENGKAKTKLVLTESEMKELETYIIEKNIMNYLDKITFESKQDIGRGKSYLTIYLNGQKKTIVWINIYTVTGYTKEMKNQVKNLDELGIMIFEMLHKKEEFKKLPEAKGGYL